MNKNIEEFINRRPDVVAAYGYGSGVFKQTGYTKKDKPQIDLILVVDDLKKWHIENMKRNKKDYSLIGKLFFKYAKLSTLKGNTGITYVSNIKENGNTFKYGTIEKRDLIDNMNTLKSFYMPGRFQKTIYPIIEDEELKEAIKRNRENGLIIASYLQENDIVSKKDIFKTLCGLSYLGDTRMGIAENPNKVLNIVEGSFAEFNRIYSFNNEYLKEKDNSIIINKDVVREKLNVLPKKLLYYIGEELNSNDLETKKKILEYFENLNKIESKKQTIKGLFTNGIIRSIIYASKKIGKRFKK